jgi:Flp pilus assembly protein protease CpaA
MGIGASIFLIAIGAILTFAVHATLSGVSVQTVGVILMIAGALGLLVTLTIFAPRRRGGDVVEERHVYDDRPATY